MCAMKLVIERSERNEATSYPWWLIIDPEQMMRPSVDSVASMVTGPYFSREEAESVLKGAPHRFSQRARVTGYHSVEYRRATDLAHAEGGTPDA